MRPLPELLYDRHCPTAKAAVQVLAAFGYSARPVSEWREAQNSPPPVLLVHDRTGQRLPLLAPLRREGFAGPVVVLGALGRIELIRRHRVLLFGVDSVAAWSPGRSLAEIISAISSPPPPLGQGLPPVGEDVLVQAKAGMTIPTDFLPAYVQPCLERLRATGVNAETIREVHKIVDLVTDWSSFGRHSPLAIGGQKANVGSHLDRLLGELTSAAVDLDRVVTEFQAAFSAWLEAALSETP